MHFMRSNQHVFVSYSMCQQFLFHESQSKKPVVVFEIDLKNIGVFFLHTFNRSKTYLNKFSMLKLINFMLKCDFYTLVAFCFFILCVAVITLFEKFCNEQSVK